ncbi:MAG: hypothetical protein RLZZ546_2261, partial [Bacteroidota bacterium]
NKSDTIYASVSNEFGCTKTFKKPIYVGVTQNPAFETIIDLCSNFLQINYELKGVIEIKNIESNNVFSTTENKIELMPGKYSIKHIVGKGNFCETSLTKELIIEPPVKTNGPLFSNIFSPNNDNKNDLFCPFFIEDVSPDYFEFKIFDKWGNLVFKSNNLENCWDGNINNTPCEIGVYTYLIHYKELQCNHIIKIKTGNVTLID